MDKKYIATSIGIVLAIAVGGTLAANYAGCQSPLINREEQESPIEQMVKDNKVYSVSQKPLDYVTQGE